MYRFLLFPVVFFTSITVNAQNKLAEPITYPRNYKRQNELTNFGKNEPAGKSLEYVGNGNKTGIKSSDNYKHSSQGQRGRVLPTRPVEKKSHGFFSNRNYKRQF
jgi:hypothetical protein